MFLEYSKEYVLFIFSLWGVVCSVILLPIAITFYITWGFIRFVDGFFSPIYNHLGINIFGKLNYYSASKDQKNNLGEFFSAVDFSIIFCRAWICYLHHIHLPSWYFHVILVGSFCSYSW